MTGAQAYMPGFEAEERKPELSQWYTQPELAERMWRWAWRPGIRRVLEPSAGSGNLIAPIVASRALEFPFNQPNFDVHAMEIDPTKAVALRARFPGITVFCGDFLKVPSHGIAYDLVEMNPPYEDGQDVEHIDHALNFAPRVVALVLHQILFAQSRRPFWTERARILRGVRLSKRPKFGPEGGERDFVIVELERRTTPAATDHEQWEWW